MKRMLAGLAGVGLAAGVIAMTATAADAAVNGTVGTSAGVTLTIRQSPSTSAAKVGSYANGAKVSITCQTTGTTVTGKYGTSSIWDKTSKGYIADAYVYTGSDGFVAPSCGTTSTCTYKASGQRSCAAAVNNAISRLSTKRNSSYVYACDHIVGLDYGLPHSGSTTAYRHWLSVPAAYKHAGSRSVPAGGLAFFSGGSSGAGHVMISLGGGSFASNDIHGAGTYTRTTIAEIESRWGQHYLGWTQPWFAYNH